MCYEHIFLERQHYLRWGCSYVIIIKSSAQTLMKLVYSNEKNCLSECMLQDHHSAACYCTSTYLPAIVVLFFLIEIVWELSIKVEDRSTSAPYQKQAEYM